MDRTANVFEPVFHRTTSDTTNSLRRRRVTTARHSTDRQLYDLIILEVLLPDLDGASFLAILRDYATRGATPVIVLTALDGREAMVRIDPDETSGVLEKRGGGYADELIGEVQKVVGLGRHARRISH